VHDSIVVDVYPGEQSKVVEGLKWAMAEMQEEVLERFNYALLLPLDIEVNIGPNWMEQIEISID
jgi:DNA polymerase I-like protein with 3'-5' exonuclease and polymerase domains